MIDLTTITTPFGLLDTETREALRAHGGPYQVFAGNSWGQPYSPHQDEWCVDFAYRVKPAPPKPREFWLLFDHAGKHGTFPYVYAQPVEASTPEGFVIHVREVLP